MGNGKYRSKVFTNFFWRFAERSLAQIIQFLVSIVLARILTPDDYGTVALVLVITQILQVFVDSGLGNALIQKKDTDDVDFSTVFYFNVVWCVLLYLFIFVIAPYIAEFYKNEKLTSVIRVLSITVIVSGVKNVQQAYVSRNLLFKKFFWATLFGTISSAIVGITLAYKGGGIWALVAQYLTNLSIDTLMIMDNCEMEAYKKLLNNKTTSAIILWLEIIGFSSTEYYLYKYSTINYWKNVFIRRFGILQ